jgi:hypothetical protein
MFQTIEKQIRKLENYLRKQNKQFVMFADSRFPGMDFLSSPDETDNDSPIGMTVLTERRNRAVQMPIEWKSAL